MSWNVLFILWIAVPMLFARSADKNGEEQFPLPCYLKRPSSPMLSVEQTFQAFKLAPILLERVSQIRSQTQCGEYRGRN